MKFRQMARIIRVLVKLRPSTHFEEGLFISKRCASCGTIRVDGDKNIKTDCDMYAQSRREIQIPSFTNPFGADTLKGIKDRKLEYSERRLLGYSMGQMYDIVSDVERYTEFVPYCTKADIHKRQGNHFKAEMTIGFPPVQESYTCIVTASKPYLVRSEATEGALFNHLLTTWRFSPGIRGHPNTCNLDFAVSFEFRSRFHSHLATVFFDSVVTVMVSAFTKRANALHGPESLKTLPRKMINYSSH